MSTDSFSAKCDAILAKCDQVNLDRAFARCDADFREADHPRDSDGKFGSGGGSHVTTEYKFAGQPDDRPSKPSTEKNSGYGGAGVDKHGNRVQHAWEKEPRPGDHPIARPPGQKPSETKSPPTSAPTVASKPVGGKSKAPFVNEFMKGSKNRESDMSRLSGLSDDKLKKALDLITSHRLTDEDSVYMKELIRDVLKSSK